MLTHMHPSQPQFTCRTRPFFNGPVIPAQSPGPAKARQAPRAPLPAPGVTSRGVVSHAPHQQALPHLHRSYGLMRQTKPLPPPTVSALVGGSLQVVISPCWELALPGIISAILV